MVRFCLFVACFVIALAASAISVPSQAKAHGGGSGVTVLSNGTVIVRGHGGGVRISGGGVRISGGGFRIQGGANRFNQNGGVNRFGPRR